MSEHGYYVCEQCAHYFSSPEWPDECENCREHGSGLIPCATVDDAERVSEEQLTAINPAPSGARAE